MSSLNRKVVLWGTLVLFATLLASIPITRVNSDVGDPTDYPKISANILEQQYYMQVKILTELQEIKAELKKSKTPEDSKR